MTPEETLKVCRLAKALSPAQAVDDYTPEAWHLVLKGHRCEDALLALEQLGGEQEWIHVSHIAGRIKRIRRDRVLEYGALPDPPPELDPADTGAYSRFQYETIQRIADGDLVRPRHPEPPALLGTRDVVGELGQVGQNVPPEAMTKMRADVARKGQET